MAHTTSCSIEYRQTDACRLEGVAGGVFDGANYLAATATLQPRPIWAEAPGLLVGRCTKVLQPHHSLTPARVRSVGVDEAVEMLALARKSDDAQDR